MSVSVHRKKKSLTLYQTTKFLTGSKLKGFADDKIIVTQKKGNLSWERLKTLSEKEKMLVTNMFFFSHNPFKMPLK